MSLTFKTLSIKFSSGYDENKNGYRRKTGSKKCIKGVIHTSSCHRNLIVTNILFYSIGHKIFSEKKILFSSFVKIFVSTKDEEISLFSKPYPDLAGSLSNIVLSSDAINKVQHGVKVLLTHGAGGVQDEHDVHRLTSARIFNRAKTNERSVGIHTRVRASPIVD